MRRAWNHALSQARARRRRRRASVFFRRLWTVAGTFPVHCPSAVFVKIQQAWRPGWPLEDWMARKETGMQPLPADRALRYGSANGAHSPLQLGVLERALVTAVREHLQQLDNPAKPVILDASKPVRRSPATATFGGDGSRAPARSKYAGTSLLHCGCEPRGALFAAL